LNFNKIITYSIILFLGYGIIQFVPTGGIELSIPVIYESSEIFWFNVPLSMVIDLIFAPPFIIIMFYYIHKAITEQPLTSQPSMKKKDIIKFLLFAAGVVLVAGVIMHAVANEMNGILGNPKPPTTALQIAVYYFDEVLGHKLIHFGIAAFLIGGIITQYWHQKDPQLSRFELFGLYFWPSGIGIVYALALIEGQAGFDFLVISVVLIAIILYYIKFKGLILKDNIFTYFVLIYLISTVISIVLYGVITGFKPGYPFFYQLSE